MQFHRGQVSILFLAGLTIALCQAPAPLLAAKLETRSANPYLGAIVIDADTGQILFEDKSDAKGYPASVLKLMDLLIILEKVQEGKLTLQDKVTVTAEASKIGGSQVYLKENEVFTVDEMLYALMVQSANDAATALAIHVAGSKEGFVALMNERAKALGMKSTAFHSIHGLPPGKDQQVDITTARDLTRLCREVLKHPDTIRYTSTRERGFRDNKFILRTHNRLMANFEGCDGLKTGFFDEAGFSMAVTAKRDDTRLIAIVLGSMDRKTRDRKAAELLSSGFLKAPKKETVTLATNVPPATRNAAPVPSEKHGWWRFLTGK
ncbi:MAG: D-alanyl-D-alanine carboxypeptidase [Verrucomicrobia bacterium]|nr:D-alanyl-D-alanine carboxypeptidase [Verrucomicrobiota bacterium]MBU4248620.1 D-alanyl-D-alanine carboxypeptidase [Verrucomicrobiota bacterium]MBU4290081.1 D-alanyl-D-alanine carboxypeptidase [Verrucomicrobiota bacterium]MBU4428341.1 D-alanyl-D-alanine carboxypeptidase [Verrucomicrobiota bacterium]MBU4497747.1 D-alanyl-D-alanine carboxypeptidase [Verrucomicrobiota bacterium]